MPEEVDQFRVFGLKMGFAKVFGVFGMEEFATEDFNKSAVFHFVKVDGDRRGFNELQSGITLQFAFTKAFNHGPALTFHLDFFAE